MKRITVVAMNAVRRFLRASFLSTGGGGYNFASATIETNSSAR